jgi:hypothetical protein
MILAWLAIGPILGAILVMPLTGPSQEPWFDAPAAAIPAPALTGPSTVLSPDSGLRLFPLCSRPGPGWLLSTWSPDAEMVARLEDDLARVLPLLDLPHWPGASPIPLRAYYRQYVGISTLTHSRLIYINAFHDPERFPDWTVSAVRLCDGGGALWGLEYDPATRRFRGFSDNGSA